MSKTCDRVRGVRITTRAVFGTIAAVITAFGVSRASRALNTSFVERQNGTDHHRDAREARKTYRFSKESHDHEAATYISMYVYNFCWTVRTLRIKDEQGSRRNRSLTRAAGIADHVWSISELRTFSTVRCLPAKRQKRPGKKVRPLSIFTISSRLRSHQSRTLGSQY